MNRFLCGLAAFALFFGEVGQTKAGLINFDVDANGNPINAPNDFADTTHLTDLYASLGVHFSGPGGNDGGAILNQGGNFGENALSQPNFLAFNPIPFVQMADGGNPIGPETISFDNPQSAVSIYTSDSGSSDGFTLQAFDSSNLLVATDTEIAPPGGYAQLSVTGSAIAYVVLTELEGNSWVADDLSFTPAGASATPEPATLTMLGIGIAGMAGCGWRRRKPVAA